MRTLYMLNRRLGRGTVRPAASGTATGQPALW
ncbi:DUF4113 domain-containing protein [Hymenobacter rigui]|nr:DUF4113 domain-containing protein [Hymenobacter rigui]